MKKLMIAAFATAFAAVAQAASITWSSGTINELPSCTGGGDYSVNECVMAYVWESATQDFTTAEEVWTAVQNGTLSLDTALTAQADFIWGEADVEGAGAWSEGQMVYAAILYLHSDEQDFANADYYMANVASGIAADSGAIVSDLGNTIGGTEASLGDTAWASAQDVPEPTSGLLMLLGMAGLALRRKQK